MQQDLLANGNYAQYLAHALTPPVPGMPGTIGGFGGTQGIGPQIGSNPGFGQWGQGQFGPSPFGQAPFGQQPGIGQPQLVAQQQQIATALHQLAHQAATQAVLGQQIGATLQQLAQYVASQGVNGQQISAVLNQLAQQCAWQAQAAASQHRFGGFGSQAVYGQPFGYGQANGVGGFNRPLW
jgi:hypothetical protein